MSTWTMAVGADPDMFPDWCAEFTPMVERLEALGVEMAEHPAPEQIHEAFRILHTIKGNSLAVGLDAIGTLAHHLEDVLRLWRDENRPITPPLCDLLQAVNDRLQAMARSGATSVEPDIEAAIAAVLKGEAPTPTVAAPATVVQPGSGSASAPAVEPEETLRVAVDIAAVQELFNRAEDLRVRLAGQSNSSLARASEVLSREILMLLRRPVDKLLPRLQRLVRDTAKALGKTVEFAIVGAELAADAAVVDGLSQVLPHLLKNSLDHGLHSAEELRALGRPEVGQLSLSFRYEGASFIVSIKDDGRGIHADKVLTSAIKKGIVTAADGELLTRYERICLVFAPGFSTAEQVTAVSGRGVGMDVVATVVKQQLRGRIEVETEVNVGTCFDLIFPVAYQCNEYLLARLGSSIIGLPVGRLVSILTDDATACTGGVLMIGDDVVPVIGWAELDPRFGQEVPRPALIIDASGMKVALVVDEIVRFTSSLVQSLPPHLCDGVYQFVSGIGTDANSVAFWALDDNYIAREWNALMVPA